MCEMVTSEWVCESLMFLHTIHKDALFLEFLVHFWKLPFGAVKPELTSPTRTHMT